MRGICALRGHQPLTPALRTTVCTRCLRRLERLADHWYAID